MLSRDKVLEVASGLLEELGPDALTMRRIAVELAVDPMSLYNYVDSREALLDGIALHFLENLESVEPTGDLQTDMLAGANAFRRAAARRPRAATLLLTRELGSMTSLANTDAALGVLRRAGLTPEQSVRGFRAVFAFLVGTVLREVSVGPTFSGQDLGGLHERRDELRDAGLRYAAESAHLLAVCDHTDEFDFGIHLILRGLEDLAREAAETSGGQSVSAAGAVQRRHGPDAR
ncbi:TetR/AcrR family transcriptional regulator [Mycobacterium sp. 94-17]|uniref:TetR/AcrR family transcriptional regulator n=1 Tax=Mycobacterium sp. 94-17 TaxID=2986147 RepID=UPI002D1F25E5|nr:TetR/AcrR family transcriptional regulator C-terminal domain-containing protein [Mycobacterium sp. 94-17]MEB4209297.1 TetR/AcrR family transcriptional regulator C-terminal domain-containing protein [Mycobacterium sp. 94-17]